MSASGLTRPFALRRVEMWIISFGVAYFPSPLRPRVRHDDTNTSDKERSGGLSFPSAALEGRNMLFYSMHSCLRRIHNRPPSLMTWLHP